jgi:D-3-phosphoglycerate dehydrogenase
MKVLVSDNLSKEGLELLNKETELEVALGLDEIELCEKIRGFDALIVRSGTQVTKKVIASSDKLRVIGRAGVGVDNIDVEAATEKGIIVLNAPEGNTIAAAELTMAMMLSLTRLIPQATSSMKNGRWDKKSFMGVELRGKTLGIIGLGRIGKEVAKRARSFDLRIMAYDPYLTAENAKALGVILGDYETVISNADYITFHVPLTEKTHHILSTKEFEMVKPGVRIINCARGGIIDEDALYDAIKTGKVAGAALDVFEEEPPKNNKLIELPNVIHTPHLGASTVEAQVNVAVDVAKSVVEVLKNGNVRNAVNMMPLKPDEWEYIRPYNDLCEKMGRFYTQFRNGRISRMEVIYQGDIAEHQIAPVTSSALKGLLNPILQEPINLVNAKHVAHRRGIEVIESKSSSVEDFTSLITLKVTTDKGIGSVSGTIYSKKEARIVMIDDFEIELVPEGYMLLTYHTDRPGFIGKVGTLLGNNDINIATMQVGRRHARGEAVMALTVDDFVPPELLKKIQQIDGVNKMKFVQF